MLLIDTASAAPSMLLSVQDLPTGFTQVPASDVEGCQPQGDHGELAAFVLRENVTLSESICISVFLLTEQAANESQAALMRQMVDTVLDHPQAMIEQTGAQKAIDVNVLSPLPSVGDKVAGFTKQDESQRHETLLFRRGDFVASVAIHYKDGTFPAASLEAIATNLDERIRQLAPVAQPPTS
ncbi:MAG: hypothetical protein HC769_19290 [Cyanobacteria bacterium CRU_2_1]|nr:hypothetical protein [Cyanobacteria bacterium RU_5_0]NJR60773.1 hypothetical protein [Cyanobacteria bacterium CRU_2_1]